jgi:cytochrome c biogenesis protein CcmG/thiol:disulfide interchange protein DsbE
MITESIKRDWASTGLAPHYYRNVTFARRSWLVLSGSGAGRRIRSVLCLAALCAVSSALCLTGCNRTPHPGSIGDPAPNFVIHDGAQTVSLDQYRGKIVVLNFWTSWCPPCLEEFPSLIQLQKDMPNIVVLAVSFDTDTQAYRQYLIDNHIQGIVTAVDPSQHANEVFGTTRPPESYIIDRKGIIRRKVIGPIDWTDPEMINFLKHL